ncbi:hypothetical protein PHET_11455 [Paragonimus heterotremus]|uniref:Uncharacterized protein n=1 Tax=Paragonimus heterotremus TaxID=100268 RepID=A0A8J4SJJ3_9TREM|nr:hypothetical protein PHET_11455 [Paragonimus heterotremus]
MDARSHPRVGKYLALAVDHSRTGVPCFALASLYKSYHGKFHYSNLNQMQKSLVPSPRITDDHYLLLDILRVHVINKEMKRFRWTPLKLPAKKVGIRITIEKLDLVVEFRQESSTSTNTVPLNKLGWVNAWMSLDLHIDKMGISIRANESGYKRPSSCYADADFLLKLHGMEVNHNGEINVSTAIRTILDGYLIDHVPCLARPDQCKHGALTLSFWTRIDSITDMNGMPFSQHPLRRLKSILLSTGKESGTGIRMELIVFNKGGGIQLDIIVSLATENQLWSIYARNSTQFGRWMNIGLHWSPRTYARPGILELYLDGHRKYATSVPVSKMAVPQLFKAREKLYINRAIYVQKDAERESEAVIINGSIHHIAFWKSSAVNCTMPLSAKRILLGMCSPDPNLVEPIPCAQ